MNRLLGNPRMAHLFSGLDDDCEWSTEIWNQALDRIELRFTLNNDLSLIYPLAAYLREQVAAFDLCDGTLKKHVGIALEEALLNALYHGNLELSCDELRRASDELLVHGRAESIFQRQQSLPYRNRRIHVTALVSRHEAEFVIRDEGPGFDYAVCTPLVIDDGELNRPTGRGLLLMYSFMDEVRFNESGNQVTMRLQRSAT